MQITKAICLASIITTAIPGCKPSTYSRASEGEDGSFSLSLSAVMQNGRIVATLTGNRANEARVTNISLSDRMLSHGAITQNQAADVAAEFSFTIQIPNANCDITTSTLSETKTVACRNGAAVPSASPSPGGLGYYSDTIPEDFASMCKIRLRSTATKDNGGTPYCLCRKKDGSNYPIYLPNVVDSSGVLVVNKFDRYIAENCMVAANTNINESPNAKDFDARLLQFKTLCNTANPQNFERNADGSICLCLETGLAATADDFAKRNVDESFFTSCRVAEIAPSTTTPSAKPEPTTSPSTTPNAQQ